MITEVKCLSQFIERVSVCIYLTTSALNFGMSKVSHLGTEKWKRWDIM